MSFDLEEAITYYRRQGAPGDQNALRNLLQEVQQAHGAVPMHQLTAIASAYGIRESYLAAIVRRFPSLRLADTHTLELCAGPNCSRSTALAKSAEDAVQGTNIQLKRVPCMRLCGKGPNLKWDGTLYHRADEALLRRLISEGKQP